MSARPLVALLDGASELCRAAAPPGEPFDAHALADAALILQGDLLDLVGRIHAYHQNARQMWAAHDRELATLDPAGVPPPPPPPPPPTESAGPGDGSEFPPPPPPPGGGR